MSIVITNNTALDVDIIDMGLTISANSSLSLNNTDNWILADSLDIITLVNNGTLTVTVPSNILATYLNFDNSSNGFSSTNIQSAIEEAGSGLTVPVHFNQLWSEEKGKNKWLTLSEEAKGDKTLFIVPFDCKVVALTWSNEKDNVDRDIEIYKNGTSSADKIFTWQIRASRTRYKTNLLTGLSFLQGDRVAVFSRDKGKDDKKPVFSMFFKSDNNNLSEGGT